MRTVADYLAKAAEFNLLSDRESDPARKRRYTDLTESYRDMASDRQRRIVDGAIKPDPPTPLN
jgi:hypothetical protein